MKLLNIIACLVVANFVHGQTKYILVNNIKTAYKIVGTENREQNKPIIVFESGLGMGGGNFETVFKYLPENASYFIYDRNGIGESQIDNSLESDADVVDKLHLILQLLNIKPPYLLVGHSLGGPLIRLFESRYTDEVSGLVFIDPTDFMLTSEQNILAREKSNSKIGYQEVWSKMLKEMSIDKSMPEGFRLETQRELASSSPIYFKEYQKLKPVSNIPIAVMIAYNRHIEKFEQETSEKWGINTGSWFEEFNFYRVQNFSKFIEKNRNSFIMLLPEYSHGIHNQDPELVGQAISRIYNKS